MIQFDLRKGICLANLQRMCRHLLLTHVCVKPHMVFSPQPAPASKETQPVFLPRFMYTTCVTLLYDTVRIKGTRNALFRFRMCPYSTSSCWYLSDACLVTGHLVVGQHQGCQGTWTVARRRCFQQFSRVALGIFLRRC